MHKFISSLLLAYLLSGELACLSKPLQGHVDNSPNPRLSKCQPRLDKHGKPLIGKINKSFIRGYIGIRYNRESGQLSYIYPESDLNKFDIHVGDYIVKIEKELYRPCIMPNISMYPNSYILLLTIRNKAGVIKTVPVKLIPASNFMDVGQ